MSNRMNSSRWKCLASRELGLYWGEEDPIECLKVAACTVFFWYIMKCEGYFLTVCQKRSHWPKGGCKEVERRLRDITWEDWRPCQVLLQLILCMMNISWSLLYYSCSLCKYQLISHNELISRPAVYFIVSKPVLYKCTICSDSLLLSRHSLG